MKMIDEEQGSSRYSARNMAKPINLYCNAPQAQSVQVQGDFSHWIPLAMQRRVDGWWFLQVPVTHGHHRYRFLVDGRPQLDPQATGMTRNDANEVVSIVAVS